MNKSINGFTIVELLIVIVVIAILATITIVAYNGIQNRGYDSSVQSDMASITKNMELARIDAANDTYPLSNTMPFVVKVNKNAYETESVTFNGLVCASSDNKQFLLLATSKSGKRFSVQNGSSVKEYTGGVNWTGGDANAICNGMQSGWVGVAAMYRTGDGPWRPWAGGN